MHDKDKLRRDPDAFARALARRGLTVDVAQLLALDAQDRGGKTRIQALQARANEIAKSIPLAKKSGQDVSALVEEGKALKQQIAALESGEGGAFDAALATLPNLLAEEVPDGPDESHNHCVRTVGQPQANAAARDHVAIGEALGQMDFAAAAKLSGARFVVLRHGLARLERALAAFMLDLHTREFGYEEVSVPYLVRDDALYGTGQLPKFAEDLFRTTSGYWLIPTAEVSLSNLVAGDILDAARLPLRMTAWTPCFRSEAGAAGRDTRGMIRQHQFSKVELVSITAPEDSAAEHERMLGCAEEVLKRLGLAYRVMLLCSGDTGFSATKTYDLEVWLAGQQTYREISSCSNCGDFQARRMKARLRRPDARETQYVHTLNGSALAVGRTLVAILEQYAQADGTVRVPAALVPYMGGEEVITASASR